MVEHQQIGGPTMDWRLIAAVSAAAGSFCFVAVGAFVVLTNNPAPQRTFTPAPALISEYRFPVTTTPTLLSVQPASPSVFAPQGNSAPLIPAAAPGLAPARVGASAPSANPPQGANDFNKSSYGRAEPRREQQVVGYKTAALTPSDAAARHEPPPPVVEVKKSSVVAGLHT